MNQLIVKVVRPEGVEPPAYRFEACRSIQLSYGRIFKTSGPGAGRRDGTTARDEAEHAPERHVDALVAFLQTVRSHGFPSHDFDVLFI